MSDKDSTTFAKGLHQQVGPDSINAIKNQTVDILLQLQHRKYGAY